MDKKKSGWEKAGWLAAIIFLFLLFLEVAFTEMARGIRIPVLSPLLDLITRTIDSVLEMFRY